MPPGIKGKGKVKGKGKGSSSDSSSDDSSSSSDSEDGGGKRPRKAQRKAADDGIVVDKEKAKRAQDKRSQKEKLVADVLVRWWYAPHMKEWPPKDEEYYRKELLKRQLRKVEVSNWEWEDDQDEKGFRKCYGLAQFYGVFRDSTGALIDLRPKDLCPFYENYMKKDMAELYELLEQCLEGQLQALEKSVYDEIKTKADIMSRLARVRDYKIKFKDLQGKKTVIARQ